MFVILIVLFSNWVLNNNSIPKTDQGDHQSQSLWDGGGSSGQRPELL